MPDSMFFFMVMFMVRMVVVSMLVCIMSLTALDNVGFSTYWNSKSDSVFSVLRQSKEVEEVVGACHDLGGFWDHSISSVVSVEVGIDGGNVSISPGNSLLWDVMLSLDSSAKMWLFCHVKRYMLVNLPVTYKFYPTNHKSYIIISKRSECD